MTKFSEYIKRDIPTSESFTPDQQATINEAIDRYSGYSEKELMQELLSQTNLQKQNGEFDEKRLENIKNTLTPYLNSAQQEKLNEIMKMVK